MKARDINSFLGGCSGVVVRRSYSQLWTPALETWRCCFVVNYNEDIGSEGGEFWEDIANGGVKSRNTFGMGIKIQEHIVSGE